MANENAIQKAAEAKVQAAGGKQTMQQYLKQMEGEIKKALPAVMTPERFTRIVLSALSTTPKLAECTPQSFLGAVMTAAQLGVEPNTPLGQAYLIPFYNGKTRSQECQFQLGYKGWIDLAYRSGEVSIIQAQIAYENDEFIYSFGLNPVLKHVPARSNRGEPAYAYAMFQTKEGGYGFEVMSVEDVHAHARKYSKTYGNGPWQTSFEEMAKKTLLKRVLKYAPLKSDFVRGAAADGTVKTEISEDMYTVKSTYVEVDSVDAEDAQTTSVSTITEDGEITEGVAGE